MLKKSARLTTREFDEVIKNGHIVQSSFFILRFHKIPGPTKISAVAPAKIIKTAAKRNSARRKMYAALRSIYPGTQAGLKIIIVAKSPVVNASSRDLEPQIRNLFVKAGVLK